MSSVLRPFRSEATILPGETPNHLQLKPNFSCQPPADSKKRKTLFPSNGLGRGGRKPHEFSNGSGGSGTVSGNTSTQASNEISGNSHIHDGTSPSPCPASSATTSPQEPCNEAKLEQSNMLEPSGGSRAPKLGLFQGTVDGPHDSRDTRKASKKHLGLRGFYSTNTLPENALLSPPASQKSTIPKLGFLNRAKRKRDGTPGNPDHISMKHRSTLLLKSPAPSNEERHLPDSRCRPVQLHRGSPAFEQDSLFPSKTQNSVAKASHDPVGPRRSVPMKMIGSLFAPLSARKSSPSHKANLAHAPERSIVRESLGEQKKEKSEHSTFSKEESPAFIDSEISSLKSEDRRALGACYERTSVRCGGGKLERHLKHGAVNLQKPDSKKALVKVSRLPLQPADKSDSSSVSNLSTLPSIMEPPPKIGNKMELCGSDRETVNTQSLASHAGEFALSARMELWDEMEVMMFLKEIHMEMYQEVIDSYI